MGKFIKILVIFFIVSAVLCMVFSCGTTEDGGENGGSGHIGEPGGDGGDPAADGNSEIDVNDVIAALPAADFGGEEFNIWTSNRFNETLEGRQAPDEEETGDIVNDALFRRDRLIDEKYNIEIKYTIIDDENALLTRSRSAISAGDDLFDFGMDNLIIYTAGLAQLGLLFDFNGMPNVDLDKEWWSQYARRDLTINGRFFFPTGDISARYPGSQYLMLFNKKLLADLGLDYPYQTILEGNWTLDALFDLTKHGTFDLNGDGVLNKDDDRFGCFVETIGGVSFLHAGGGRLTTIVDGDPVFDVRNERTVALIDRLAEAWTEPDQIYYPQGYNVYDEVAVFKDDRALFAAMTGTNAGLFRDMESEFGIVPLPKFDVSQQEYYSYCQPWGSAAVNVPITVQNIERAGTIIEAMAAAGRYTSTIAVYDVTFKIKYAHDEESSQMLDIITGGSVYDFAHIYNWGGAYDAFNTAIARGESYLTRFDAIEDRANSAMERTIEAFLNIE